MQPSNPDRRAFLRGQTGGASLPLRPPWTGDAALAERCTRCGDCLTACPERVLIAGDGGFPAFDPRAGSGACSFCGACAEACPEDLFVSMDERPWDLIALISPETCLAGAGIHCESCRDACPEVAVRFTPRVGGPPRPEILSDICSGCGACVGACPSAAISLHHEGQEKGAA
jgi:ferredoxin-type protein NapF